MKAITWLAVAGGVCIELIAVTDAAACQCGSIPAPSEALERSEAVVAGLVTSIVRVKTPIEVSGRKVLVRAQEVEIKVSEVWKGTPTATLRVVVGRSDCDYRFSAGEAFLIYVDRIQGRGGELTATICKPTKRLSAAAKDRQELGPSQKVKG